MLNARGIGLIGIINGLSVALGFAYSIVLARYFGTGTGIEVYFASTTLLFMINSLSQSGQLAEIVMPVYHRFQSESGQEKANRVMSVVFSWVALIAASFSLLAFVFAPQLFYASSAGFEAEALREGTAIFRWICPLIFLEIMKSQITSLVNAEKKFGKIEWINVLNQVFSMACVVLLSGRWQIYAVVAGLWIGEVLAFGYGLYVLFQTRFRYRVQWTEPGFSLRDVLGNMAYTFAYVIITQGFLFYMNNLLTHLPRGQYAVFKYAQLIYSKIQGLMVRPLSTVFFAQFSSAFHAKSDKLRHLVYQTSSLSFVLSSLVYGGLLASGLPILRILWEGDKFTPDAVRDVYLALLIAGFGLFINSVALIYRKISMTLGLVKSQYRLYIGVQLASALALFLMQDIRELWPFQVFVLVNNLGLTLTPVFLVWRYSPRPIPVSIGRKAGINISFFTGILAVSGLLAWFMPGLSIPGGLFSQVALCVGILGLASLGLAYFLRIEEWNLLIRLRQKVASRL